MTTSRDKVLQYLEEAHGTEAALFSTLSAHIAMTPRGEYRELLERHRAETRAQAQRIQGRLGELGSSKSIVHVAYGLAQTATGQAVSLALAPLNLLRGTGGEEKLLKNAKDEAASEMLEIATYDALEALAEAVGDEKTAVLAREHRTQEEVFLRQLREVIPSLAEDVVRAELEGDPSFDVTTTGAADAARTVAAKARGKAAQAESVAQQAADGAKQTAAKARSRAGAVADDVQDAAADVRDEVQDTAQDVAGQVQDAAGDVAERVQETASDVRDEVEETADDVADRASEAADDVREDARSADAEEAEELASGVHAVSGDEELPIDGYDTLSVQAILPKLRTLAADELARVDGYERANKDRKRVTDRIAALRNKRLEEQLGAPTA